MNIGNLGGVEESVKSRRYRSELRQQQASETRRAVLRAAYGLFTMHGYAATGVSDIARGAGVSIDTVYASVGRKPQLLLAVHDMVLGSSEGPIPAEQRGYVMAIRAASSAREMIRLYVEALGRLLPQTVPLSIALRQAGRTDPECRAVWESLSERRATNMRLFAQDLRSTGDLREDLTDDEVGDLIWSMNSPEYFTLLANRGYTPDQYADLVADVWRRTLLR